MLHTDYAKKILDALLFSDGATKDTSGTPMAKFSATPYLGLYVATVDADGVTILDDGMPDADGTGGNEVTNECYSRIPLKNTGLQGLNIIGNATYEPEYAEDGVTVLRNVAKIRNQEMIVFPEAEETDEVGGGAWGYISGFGIFQNKTATKPMFWARIVDPSTKIETVVKIDANDVPIIRIGNFEISLC